MPRRWSPSCRAQSDCSAIATSARVAELSVGDTFDVLELAGNHAWGRATAQNLVGYVDRTALDIAVPQDDAA